MQSFAARFRRTLRDYDVKERAKVTCPRCGNPVHGILFRVIGAARTETRDEAGLCTCPPVAA